MCIILRPTKAIKTRKYVFFKVKQNLILQQLKKKNQFDFN
jgi:hypothetical protein